MALFRDFQNVGKLVDNSDTTFVVDLGCVPLRCKFSVPIQGAG